MSASLPTRDDYFQVGAAEVLARSLVRPNGQRISREAIFTEGTDINIIIAACAAMADESTRQLSMKMAALYLDSAEGEDLDRLVADRFSPSLIRKQAAPAVVDIKFSRGIPPSAGAAITYKVGTKIRTEQGTQFKLVEAAAFPLDGTGPIVAKAEALLSGEASNVGANQIKSFAGANPDPNVLIKNEEPASGGRDVESEESLRNRARDFYISTRRGVLKAIEVGAITVGGVETATAFEEVDSDGIPTGYVTLSIADRNGQANQLLASAVRTALLEYRAAGIVVDILLSSPFFQDIFFGLSFKSGTDQRSAIAQIKNITVSAVNLLDPGETLQRSLLYALARSVPGVIVNESAITTPAGDVVPSANQSIKTSLDRIFINGL